MSLSRREFIVGAGAVAASAVAGCVANPAPVVEASIDRTFPLPFELQKPGGQVKVKMPGGDDTVLVWRTEVGFGATTIRCTHCAGEMRYVPGESLLRCPFNIRYKLDGTAYQDSVKRKPLRAYIADVQGDRLRILG
ncbi:MAG TPA: twin-arginine translocation signal domain-containing protein [Planctomycetota bacterium]